MAPRYEFRVDSRLQLHWPHGFPDTPWDCHRTADQARGGAKGVWLDRQSALAVPWTVVSGIGTQVPSDAPSPSAPSTLAQCRAKPPMRSRSSRKRPSDAIGHLRRLHREADGRRWHRDCRKCWDCGQDMELKECNVSST